MKLMHHYQLQKKHCLPKFNLIILLTGLLLLQAGFSFAQWTRKADALRKRAECPSVAYQGKIYVFGGFGEHPNFENDNEVYDPALNKWSLIAPFPTGKAISHQSVVLVDDKVWQIGGRAIDNRGPVSSQVIIYNITTNTWQNGPELKDPATGNALPLGAGGAALLGRTIHFFGGFGPTICIDQDKYHLSLDVDKYNSDPANTKWENNLAPMPVKRNHLNTASVGGKIYAIGGQFIHDCGGADQKYVHVYDPIANTWTRLTDLPEPRSHSEGATFAVDGKIYTCGGQGANGAGTNKVFVLTPSGNNGLGSWGTATQYQLPNEYYGISAKVVGSSFIISHGAIVIINDERKETYTAPFTRNTPNTFGFVAKCFDKTVSTNQKIILKNLLYTIEGSKGYTLSSNVSWLKATKNATGTALTSGIYVEATADAAGLANGTYTGIITATGAAGGTTFTSASFCVNLTVSGATGGQQVVSFTLVNADSDNDIQTINNGATINKANLPTQNLNIRANTNPAVVGSVKLSIRGAENRDKTENSAPYALFGESGGNYLPWVAPVGSFNLTATPYSSRDGAGTAGTPLTINFTVVNSGTTQPLISNITSNTGRSYALSTLNTGVTIYTDRTYQTTTVPSFLNGAPFIKTPNDDKNNTSASAMFSFALSQDATVYVGFDPRTTALPAWLSSWQKLTDKIGINDPAISQLDLFSKSYPAGTVSLGGPKASPSAGGGNNYIVVAQASQNLPSSVRLADKISIENAETVASGQQSKNNSPNAKVSKLSKDFKMQVYPNPATGGNVHVALKSPVAHEAVTIVMYNAQGKSLQSKTIFTDNNGYGKIEFSLKGNTPGFYIFKAKSASGNKQLKLMLE